MEKKKYKIKNIIVFIIIAATLLGSGVVFAAGLNDFGNIFSIENGIGQTLNNVNGVVTGKLTWVYTERNKLIKDDGRLNVIETSTEEEDDNAEPYEIQDDLYYNAGSYPSSVFGMSEKVRYRFKGALAVDDTDDGRILNNSDQGTKAGEPSPRTIKDVLEFLNSAKDDASKDVTGIFALDNFNYLYCMRYKQPIGRYHSNFTKIGVEYSEDVSQFFKDPKTKPYDIPAEFASPWDKVSVEEYIGYDWFEQASDNPYGLGGSVAGISVPTVSNPFINNMASSNGRMSKVLAGAFESVGSFNPVTSSKKPTTNRHDPLTQRSVTRNSNVTYMLYPDIENTLNYKYYKLYSIENDQGTNSEKDTNAYAYAAAFSEKKTLGYWERTQAAVWAAAGKEGFNEVGGNPTHSNCENQSGNGVEGDPDDVSSSDDVITVSTDNFDASKSCLYKSGHAVDEYEADLTKNISGSDEQKHEKALEGTDKNLRNQILVSTKPQGSVSFSGQTHTVANDYTDSDIGTIKDATGTVLFEKSGEKYYKIGPFVMDDYSYAASDHVEEFSGLKAEKYKNLLGGIVSGELTFVDDNNAETFVQVGNDEGTTRKAHIVYDAPQGGTTVEGEDSYVDSSGNGFLVPVENYEYPKPQSIFYIEIPVSLCNDATMLKNIRFVYRQTYTDGDGWVIISRYVQTTWTAVAGSDEHSEDSYSCENEPTAPGSYSNSRQCDSDLSPHKFGSCKGKKGDKSHKDSLGCSCPCDHSGSCSSCNLVSDGKGGTTNSCNCTSCPSELTCSHWVYCEHGFRDCAKTTEVYRITAGPTVKQGQPFLVVRDAIVDLRDYCYDAEVWVRLTTDVSINKYIYDVEHTPNEGSNEALDNCDDYNSTYPEALLEDADLGVDYAAVTREKLAEQVKEDNPVYVEFGDTVIYHIQLINKQKKDITLKVQDILPEDCRFLSIQNITDNMDGIDINGSDFTTEVDIGDGDDVKLTQGSPDDTKILSSIDERTIKTDWILVPGREDGEEQNIVTLSVKIMVEYWNNDKKFENKAVIITRNAGPGGDDNWKDIGEIEDYMRVVDNGVEEDPDPSTYPNDEFPFAGDDSVPGPVVNIAELDPEVDDRTKEMPKAKIVTSDWYILNNYNAFMDKFIYKYDEAMQHENESYTYTKDGYISAPDAGTPELYYEDTDQDDVLVKPRVNDNSDTEELDGDTHEIVKHVDPYIIDTVRVPGDDDSVRYNEFSKKIHPVSVEKSEIITYAVKVSNEANLVNKNEKSKATAGVIGGTGTTHISGSKPATQVRPTKVSDYLESGLQYISVEAYIYDETGGIKQANVPLVSRYSQPVSISDGSASGTPENDDVCDNRDSRTYEGHEYVLDSEYILNPGECIVYFITAKVRESNMYLKDLDNNAEINILTNINQNPDDDEDRVVRDENDEDYNMNIALQETSSDWVRLKDLVIAGRVWVDFNRDGYMNEEEITSDKEYYKEYYNVDEYGRKKEVVVKLYRSDRPDTELRTTKTDEYGLYTFGRKEDGSSYYDEYNYEEVSGHSKEYSSNDTYQRVDKAESKDEYGNYEDDAEYIDYYVEFEYDGVVYRSTEFYSGDDNIIRTDGDNFGMYDNGNEYADDADDAVDHSGDQRYTDLHDDDGTAGDNYLFKYQVDSNAAEFKNVRQEYNAKFEYISYNIAYEATGADATATKTNNPHDLDFDKKNHVSELMEDKYNEDGNRFITARSFINNATLAGTHRNTKLPEDVNSYNWDDEGISVDKSNDNTQLLWLCKKDEQEYEKVPETEYLKHINLGLELRENVDLALTKDVYKVKTTINGEEMEYTYNKNNGLNGDMPADDEYLQDYIIKKPYGLELYESDYKYRYDQYKAKEVREYKGEESELNIEVTYRITVKNKAVSDDDELKEKIGDRTPAVKDTKFDVKLHEVLDLYDQNFITYSDKESDPQTIDIKTKNEQGFLKTTPIKIAEAWYFKEGTDGGDDEKIYFVENEGSGDKPVYKAITDDVPEGRQTYIRKDLKLANHSQGYSNSTMSIDENESGYDEEMKKNQEDSGYKRLYIYGMDNDLDYFTIPEDEERDIYVKYVVDKDALSIDMDEKTTASWNDTQEVTTRSTDGNFEQVHVTTESTTTSTIQRSLKIAEKAITKLNPRGTENIAQINGYSVWYSHSKLPASIVDMDSNVGNVGIKNVQPADDYSVIPHEIAKEKFVDDIEYYEDTVYKTGIEIIAERTENTEDKMLSEHGVIKFRREEIENITRELSGLVWDDARTETLDVEGSEAKQYLGDGIYHSKKDNGEEKEIQAKAKANGNIEEFYKNPGDLDEKHDIEVRNARAELVEIVQVPVGDEYHYYEEILANVTWDQTQHTRTGSDGKYTLDGFIPGKYIVRFAYGDTVPEGEGDANAVSDMRIFNGQDYKTTQYAYELTDYAEGRSDSGENHLTSEEYKALTTDKGTIDVYAASLEDKNDLSNVDTVLAALERPNLSDARDDEIRRLEVNNYSEVMVNLKAEILKGLANGSKLTTTKIEGHDVKVNYYNEEAVKPDGTATSTNTEAQLTELTDKTNMYAETVEFLVKAEKLTFDQTTKDDYIYVQYTGKPDSLKIYYDKLDNMEFKTVEEREFKIENIDMGIEYRPETGISLIKEINNIQLITSDNEVLMDLKLYTDVDANGILTHHIDTENSIGAELVQFVTNGYKEKELIQELIHMNEEDLQGFAYIAVDEDILQGCRIIVQYKFSAQNDSEVDRVSDAINKIRFYGNDRTQALINSDDGLYKGAINAIVGDKSTFYLNIIQDISTLLGISSESTESTRETQYTANNLARNIVRYDVYDSLPGLTTEDVYRDRAKTMIKDTVNTINDPDDSDGYFGKYVGYTYYIGNDYIDEDGNPKNLDVVSELKFDKIIDYVDSDLEFGQLSQTDITNLTNTLGNVTTTNKRNSTTASGVDSNLLSMLDPEYDGDQGWTNNSEKPVSSLIEYLYSLSKKAMSHGSTSGGSTGEGTSEGSEEGTSEQPFVIAGSALSMLTNLEGIEYKSLLVSNPDRSYDGNDKDNRNQLFAKFLSPSIVNKDESIATVYLPVSKVLATETDMENMQYENIAEVIQFTVLTGRRTNFDTTIGNADIHEVDRQVTKAKYDPIGSIEFVTAALEPDTASTETITLTPPTGLMRNRRVIREAVDTTTNVIEIAVIAIAVVVTILIITKFTIVKIKKKRYK